MKTVSATYARAHLYDLIDEISLTGKRVAITKKGEIKAVLISAKEYEEWKSLSVKILSKT